MYAQVAKDIFSKKAVPLPSLEVLEEYRSKYPVYFEITDRIAAIGANAFKSAEVAAFHNMSGIYYSHNTQAGQEALFSDDIMNRFNKSQPHYVAVVEQLTKTFDEIVSSIAKQGKNVLKVLDVGGGKPPLHLPVIHF